MSALVTRLLLVFSLSLCAGLSAANESDASNSNWLIGTWTLCEDPDHSPKDWMHFEKDHTGFVSNGKKRFQFQFKVNDRNIVTKTIVRGSILEQKLIANPTFDRLFYTSNRSGNTAVYIRTDNAKASKCTVK